MQVKLSYEDLKSKLPGFVERAIERASSVKDNNFDGTTAGFGIAYKFTDKFEIESKYKYSDLETDNNVKFDTDRINLAFNFRFGK